MSDMNPFAATSYSRTVAATFVIRRNRRHRRTHVSFLLQLVVKLFTETFLCKAAPVYAGGSIVEYCESACTAHHLRIGGKYFYLLVAYRALFNVQRRSSQKGCSGTFVRHVSVLSQNTGIFLKIP